MLLHDVLNHAVKLFPNKTATIDGDVEYTYAESGERIRRLAAGLLSLGLKPGDHILDTHRDDAPSLLSVAPIEPARWS